MFRFLGDVKSHRKKGKARSNEKNKENDAHPRVNSSRSNNGRKQGSIGHKSSRESRHPPQMKGLDHFFDSMSIETSLYTTPSKPTIQYPRRNDRTSGNSEWHLSQDSEEQESDTDFTAELAIVQYRLAGWQSPPIIESSLTPSTESTFSSIRRDEERIKERYVEGATGVGAKSPLISAYLQTDDFDPLVLVDVNESFLEVYSTNSSEISWNFDRQAFYEKMASAKPITHHDKMATVSVKSSTNNEEEVTEKDERNDEESVCSSISSMSTNHFCRDSCESNISTWSPIYSPLSVNYDHTTLESDGASSNHRIYESHETDTSVSQSTKFSRKIFSICSKEDSISTNLNYDEQVSFSELISRCEGESLAGRLDPYVTSPGKRLFGRTIDMNSSNTLPSLSSSDSSKPQIECIETSCISKKTDDLSASKENNQNIATPEISNMLTSLPNYIHMIPNAFTTDPAIGVEAQTIGETSANVSSNDCTDFPSILQKFEAHSLEYGMEPPAPRRLTGDTFEGLIGYTFEGIANVGKREEALNCSDDELQKPKNEQNTNDKSTFQQDNRSFHKEMTIRSLSPCHEEIPSRIASNRLDDSKESVGNSGILKYYNTLILEKTLKDKQLSPSHRCRVESTTKQASGDVSDVGEKAFELGSVEDTAVANQNEHSKVEIVDKLHYPSGCRYVRGNSSITVCSNKDESPITSPILQPEMNPMKAVRLQMTTEPDVLLRDQPPYDGPVDLDESLTKGIQLEMDLQQIKSEEQMYLENLNTITQPDLSIRYRRSYYGPVDLDESSMSESSSPETLSTHVNISTSATPTNHRPHTSSSVSSILDKDDPIPSIWGDNEKEDTSKVQPQSNCDSNGFVNKAAIDQSYEEAMVSIGTIKRDQVARQCAPQGSLFLCEDELTRHEKLMERQNPLPNPTISGYDDWKREQEVERLYFEELRERLMEPNNKRGGSGSFSKEPQRSEPYDKPTTTVLGNTKPIAYEIIDSTRSKTPHRKRKKKAWKFLNRILHRNDDDPTGEKSENGNWKKKKHNKKEKENENSTELAVTNIDKFMLISNKDNLFDPDDFADLSLFPLNQLEHLTKMTGHDGLREKMLEHLEWERKRQVLAEIDKEKDEWCEQIRISILKEQELERQRRLNSSNLASCVPHREASPGLGSSNEETRFNHQDSRAQPELKLDGIVDPHKLSQEGYLYYSTPIKYLCDKPKATVSTARESRSLESCSINSFMHTNLSFGSPQTDSSLSTPKMVSTLPPCAVCKVAERTHISMPCMHYSFCSECAEELHGLETPICPICQTEDIKLSRVFT